MEEEKPPGIPWEYGVGCIGTCVFLVIGVGVFSATYSKTVGFGEFPASANSTILMLVPLERFQQDRITTLHIQKVQKLECHMFNIKNADYWFKVKGTQPISLKKTKQLAYKTVIHY